MRRVLLFLFFAVVIIAAAWWLALLPGTVSAEIGTFSFEAELPVVALGLLVLFILLYLLVRLIGGTVLFPESVRRWRTGRRRESGDLAVTRTLVALAAGDTGDARREAARARRLLGDTPQVLLLTAEAGRLSGRESEAEAAFQALAGREESAFLGLRGLLRQAMARKDWEQAAVLARKAEAAHPGAAWLRGERSQLAMRVGSWSEALALADPDSPKAALATAAAQAETDPTQGLRLAKQAWNEDPRLAPAAMAYARRLREAGREKRAQDVLRRTWAAAPHPGIGEMALAPHADPLARVQEAKRLAQENPDHPETHLLLAQVSLAAGLIGEARHQAEAARAAGLNDRRLWMLLADIEETERGDSEEGRAAQRDALRAAAVADPDPVWRCSACGSAQDAWRAACPVCGTPGSLVWTASRKHGGITPYLAGESVAIPS
jgi:HemY protein